MILILGGTKSGKSSFASQRAAGRENMGDIVYLATARAGDEEMKARIQRHRMERPESWITVEEPLNLSGFFDGLTSKGGSRTATVLLDCLTLWLTNLLAEFGEEPDRSEAMERGEGELARMINSVKTWETGKSAGDRECLVVSNLVEEGLISPWPLGRVFQDLAGLCHQALAREAEEVYRVTAGLPQRIK